MISLTSETAPTFSPSPPPSGYGADDLSRILKVLYSAVLHPDQWQVLLNLLCRHAECKHGFMLCADSQSGLSVRAQGEGPFGNPQLVDAYHQRYSVNDPFRQPIVQNRRLGVFYDEELLPDDGLLRSDLYREQLAPRGLRHATLIVATVNVRRLEAFSFWRTEEQGPLSQESFRFFETLFPHIQKALELRHILNVSEQRAVSAETMIDASPTATLLVKQDGRLIHRNIAAARLLEAGDTVCLRDGVITAASPSCKSALRSLIDKASHLPSQHTVSAKYAISLDRTSGKRAVSLLAVPLSAADRRRTDAEAMIVISDPTNAVVYPDYILQALYGLSKAETGVANGLLAGYSLEEIANLRSVSTGTVRQQLKAIMAKTGTQRQGELISLLARVPHAVDKE
jgi:DNA-binding CsgD family transcriptional regulator